MPRRKLDKDIAQNMQPSKSKLVLLTRRLMMSSLATSCAMIMMGARDLPSNKQIAAAISSNEDAL